MNDSNELPTDLNPIGFFQQILWNLCWTLEWTKYFWRDNLSVFGFFRFLNSHTKHVVFLTKVRGPIVKTPRNRLKMEIFGFFVFWCKIGPKMTILDRIVGGFYKEFFLHSDHIIWLVSVQALKRYFGSQEPLLQRYLGHPIEHPFIFNNLYSFCDMFKLIGKIQQKNSTKNGINSNVHRFECSKFIDRITFGNVF